MLKTSVNTPFPCNAFPINEQQLSLFDKIAILGFDGLSYLHTTQLNDHAALLIAPLLCDQLNDASTLIPEDLTTLNQALLKIEQRPPEFQGEVSSGEDAALEKLIASTTKQIICDKRREYLPFLNQLVKYNSEHQKEFNYDAPKFLL